MPAFSEILCTSPCCQRLCQSGQSKMTRRNAGSGKSKGDPRMPIAPSQTSALVALALFTGLAPFPSLAHADNALEKLNGSWSGSGRATFEGGKSERLTCRAYYRGSGGVSDHSFSIRCASASGKVELRASLSTSGSSVTGKWEERQFKATGALSGRVSSNTVRLTISGAVSGGISVDLKGQNRHSVSLRSTGSTLQNVEIGLRRS